jgi:hypothetical protein
MIFDVIKSKTCEIQSKVKIEEVLNEYYPQVAAEPPDLQA